MPSSTHAENTRRTLQLSCTGEIVSDESANVTLLLERAQQGELAATDELVPILYSELRSLAAVMLPAARSNPLPWCTRHFFG